jgi:hypothetical protein
MWMMERDPDRLTAVFEDEDVADVIERCQLLVAVDPGLEQDAELGSVEAAEAAFVVGRVYNDLAGTRARP